ncbi:MAG: hypothetical protein EPO65_05705 [Dehalococcoidia bacterium]|nr:MAG: hypothetical protein EPO65_05705 [Dehalococcoidia bacterium]
MTDLPPTPSSDARADDDASNRQHSAEIPRKWTGVLFVHGMGSQRRYGDVSGLVEALDQRARQLARVRATKATAASGRLPDDQFFSNIRPELEPATKADAPPITYIETKWCPEGRPAGDWPEFRFYEAYWAPITAGGVPTREVMTWLFAQVAKPLSGFVTPWRGKARLRRSILEGMSSIPDGQRRALFEAYDDFEGLDAQRDHPRSRFRDFSDFLTAQGQQNLVSSAKQWHSACVRAELGNLGVLLTLALLLVAVVGLVILTTAGLLALREGETLEGRGPLDLARYIKDHKESFAMLGSTAFLITGLAHGLKDYLGDVVFWTTYEETQGRYEKRRQILAEVRAYLSHLQRHPDCERIVVVAHSLGTAIAVDAILAEARDVRALPTPERRAQQLNQEKITHVVTYGSPIDKIHYFFERDPDQHRYHRVVEDLRGDIGTEPFASPNGRALIHWVNFWDRADIISGTLESPSNRRHPHLRVDNVGVTSGLLANPIQAHTGYLRRPAVLDSLLDVILNRTIEHRTQGYVTYLGPGEQGTRARVQLACVGLLVWFLAGLAIYCTATVSIGLAAWVTGTLAALFVAAGLLAARTAILTRLGLLAESLVAAFRL